MGSRVWNWETVERLFSADTDYVTEDVVKVIVRYYVHDGEVTA